MTDFVPADPAVPALSTLLRDIPDLATLPIGSRFETDGPVSVPAMACPDAPWGGPYLLQVFIEKLGPDMWQCTRWAVASGGIAALRLCYGDRLRLVRVGAE